MTRFEVDRFLAQYRFLLIIPLDRERHDGACGRKECTAGGIHEHDLKLTQASVQSTSAHLISLDLFDTQPQRQERILLLDRSGKVLGEVGHALSAEGLRTETGRIKNETVGAALRRVEEPHFILRLRGQDHVVLHHPAKEFTFKKWVDHLKRCAHPNLPMPPPP